MQRKGTRRAHSGNGQSKRHDLDDLEGLLEREEEADLFSDVWDDDEPVLRRGHEDPLAPAQAGDGRGDELEGLARAAWLPQRERTARDDGTTTEPESGVVERRRAGERQAGTAGGRGTASAVVIEDRELARRLAEAAAAAETTDQAVSLVAAMVPLTLRSYPMVYRGLWRSLPALIESATRLTRRLCSYRETRMLIAGALPAIVERCVAQMARQVEAGEPVPDDLIRRLVRREAATFLRLESHGRALSRYQAGSAGGRRRPAELDLSDEW